MKNNDKSPAATDPLRRIRLKLEGEQALIMPDAEGGEAVAMTRIPMSQLDWLQRLGMAFRERYNRCFASLLLLDIESREWTYCVPAQRAMADSVRWRLDRSDLPELSATHVLAGSFQMCVADDLADMMTSIPPIDGVHFVMRLMPDQARTYAFLCAESECEPISIDLLVRDDWQDMVNVLTQRMVFG